MSDAHPLKETTSAIIHDWLNGYILGNQICLVLGCWEPMRKRESPEQRIQLKFQTVRKNCLQSNTEPTAEDASNSCLKLFWKHFLMLKKKSLESVFSLAYEQSLFAAMNSCPQRNEWMLHSKVRQNSNQFSSVSFYAAQPEVDLTQNQFHKRKSCFWDHSPSKCFLEPQTSIQHMACLQSHFSLTAIPAANKHCFWIAILSHAFKMIVNRSWSIFVPSSCLAFTFSPGWCQQITNSSSVNVKCIRWDILIEIWNNKETSVGIY